jgi:hypothetical protein
MMSFWAMFASPLLMSNDLRAVEPWARAILLNKKVIAISQVISPSSRCGHPGRSI